MLAHAGDGEPLGLFYAAALYGGFALYLAGHLLFKQRMHAALSMPRLFTVGILVLALPAAAFLPPLFGLAGLVLVLGVLIVVETRRNAALRGWRPPRLSFERAHIPCVDKLDVSVNQVLVLLDRRVRSPRWLGSHESELWSHMLRFDALIHPTSGKAFSRKFASYLYSGSKT